MVAQPPTQREQSFGLSSEESIEIGPEESRVIAQLRDVLQRATHVVNTEGSKISDQILEDLFSMSFVDIIDIDARPGE